MKKGLVLSLGAGLMLAAAFWGYYVPGDPLGAVFTVLVFSAASAGIILAFWKKA